MQFNQLREDTRIALAAIAAYFSVPIGLMAYSYIGWLLNDQPHYNIRQEAIMAFGVTFLVMFPAFITIGAPIFWVFYRFGWLRFWHFEFAGTLAGTLSALALYFLLSSQITLVPGFLLFGACGLLAGSVFWFVGVYKSAL